MALQPISSSDTGALPIPATSDEVLIKQFQYATSGDAAAVVTAYNGSSGPTFDFDEPSGTQRQLTRGEILFLYDIGRSLILVLRHVIGMPYPWNP